MSRADRRRGEAGRRSAALRRKAEERRAEERRVHHKGSRHARNRTKRNLGLAAAALASLLVIAGAVWLISSLPRGKTEKPAVKVAETPTSAAAPAARPTSGRTAAHAAKPVGNAPGPTAAPAPGPGGLLAPSSTTAAKALDYLTARLGPRPVGTVTEHTAARYIYYKLIQSGYKPEIERFVLPNGDSSQNVLVTRPGASGGPVILLAASYDSRLSSPGALENAASTALLLAIAEAAEKQTGRATLRFAFLGAGQPYPDRPSAHDLGSADLASKMSGAERRALKAAYFLRGLGFGEEMRAQWLGVGKNGAIKALIAAGNKAGLKVQVQAGETGGGHAAFEKVGVPAATLAGGISVDAGSNRDLASRVNDAAYERAVRLLVRLIKLYD